MSAQQQKSDPTRRADDAAVSVAIREDRRRLSDAELERRVREGAAVWEELLDRLTSSGMLPTPEMSRRVVTFLEHAYWRAEEARVEGLRRRVIEPVLRGRPAEGWPVLDGR